MIATLWVIGGLIALVIGAELIVRGGARLAARLGIAPIIIGLTIVSVGTSTPELAVGIESALRGNGSIAVGNIAGTNTVNLLLIFGMSALLRPLALHLQTVRFDLPVMAVVATWLLYMSWDGQLTRGEGIAMIVAAVLYTLAVLYLARSETRAAKAEFAQEYAAPADVAWLARTELSVLALLGGIIIVVVGSDWLVDGAVLLARDLQISDAVIGLTVIAIGTSSPELVTTILGTIRGDRDIAIGNLLGSSIYNILVILGITCVVPTTPLQVEPDLVRIDIPVMALATLACVPVFLTGRKVSRIEGGCFVGCYVAYLLYLVLVRA